MPDSQNENRDLAGRSFVHGLKFLFALLQILIIVLTIMLFRTGYFTVEQDQQVLAFSNGAIVKADGQDQVFTSGQAHWVWPRPMGKILALPADHVPQITESNINFWPNSIAKTKKKKPLVVGRDGYIISADQNIFHLRCQLTWHIENATQFYHSFYSPSFADKINEKEEELLMQSARTSIERLLQKALLIESSRWNIDNIFYGNAKAFQDSLLAQSQKIINQANIGIRISRLDIRSGDKTAPKNVADSFESALKARVNAQKAFLDAQTEKSRTTTSAVEAKEEVIANAEVYRNRLVRRTENSTKKFLAFLKEYEESPETSLRAYYSNTITQILKMAKSQYLVFNPDNNIKQSLRLEITPLANDNSSGGQHD